MTLYNTAEDSAIDLFPNLDLSRGQRYGIALNGRLFKQNGQPVALNKLFFSDANQSMYFTGWWGFSGLYQVPLTTGIADH